MNTLNVNIGLLGAICIWLMASAAFATQYVSNNNSATAVEVILYLAISIFCVVLTDQR